ncbi:hypothetical protein DFH28DRAFT_1167731 [Melampsora americana]|nr:hypothetical protein DFH28DRAFT_1167731 [Melampsora americana]
MNSSLPGYHSPTMSKPLSPINQRTSASQVVTLLKPVSPIDASMTCTLKPRYEFYSPSKGNGNFHGTPKIEYGVVSIDHHHPIGSDMKKQSSSTLEAIPDRKNSTSSSRSSHSTLIMIHLHIYHLLDVHLPINPCSPSDASSSSSPGSATQLHQIIIINLS